VARGILAAPPGPRWLKLCCASGTLPGFEHRGSRQLHSFPEAQDGSSWILAVCRTRSRRHAHDPSRADGHHHAAGDDAAREHRAGDPGARNRHGSGRGAAKPTPKSAILAMPEGPPAGAQEAGAARRQLELNRARLREPDGSGVGDPGQVDLRMGLRRDAPRGQAPDEDDGEALRRAAPPGATTRRRSSTRWSGPTR
jgi:hypothetical protein